MRPTNQSGTPASVRRQQDEQPGGCGGGTRGTCQGRIGRHARHGGCRRLGRRRGRACIARGRMGQPRQRGRTTAMERSARGVGAARTGTAAAVATLGQGGLLTTARIARSDQGLAPWPRQAENLFVCAARRTQHAVGLVRQVRWPCVGEQRLDDAPAVAAHVASRHCSDQPRGRPVATRCGREPSQRLPTHRGRATLGRRRGAYGHRRLHPGRHSCS
jgi:hypothetical protein